jgi:hypothetical protein
MQVASMLFSSLIPHTLLNNWVPAIICIVHITVMGRLFHQLTARDGVMTAILLAFGDCGTGKTFTLRLAECINGMHMVMGANSTIAGATARMKQLAGLCAITWDDFTAEMWEKQMGGLSRSMAGGADTVKMNTHGNYSSEAFTTVAVSVRKPRPHPSPLPSRASTRPPRTTHSPSALGTTRPSRIVHFPRCVAPSSMHRPTPPSTGHCAYGIPISSM